MKYSASSSLGSVSPVHLPGIVAYERQETEPVFLLLLQSVCALTDGEFVQLLLQCGGSIESSKHFGGQSRHCLIQLLIEIDCL